MCQPCFYEDEKRIGEYVIIYKIKIKIKIKTDRFHKIKIKIIHK